MSVALFHRDRGSIDTRAEASLKRGIKTSRRGTACLEIYITDLDWWSTWHWSDSDECSCSTNVLVVHSTINLLFCQLHWLKQISASTSNSFKLKLCSFVIVYQYQYLHVSAPPLSRRWTLSSRWFADCRPINWTRQLFMAIASRSATVDLGLYSICTYLHRKNWYRPYEALILFYLVEINITRQKSYDWQR